MIITIDGPAGSGKTSVARRVAAQLGMHVLQTGLLYRAAALVLLRRHSLLEASDLSSQVLLTVRDSVTEDDLDALEGIAYGYEAGSAVPSVAINGERVEQMLNLAWLSLPASIISQNLQIREWSLQMQRAIAQECSVVAEGRDCGTVVFPEADYKFFLTASVEVRAQRMLHDTARKAQGMTVEQAQQSIKARDMHDQTRLMAPLVAACGAVVIDTSTLSLDEVVTLMVKPVLEEKKQTVIMESFSNVQKIEKTL